MNTEEKRNKYEFTLQSKNRTYRLVLFEHLFQRYMIRFTASDKNHFFSEETIANAFCKSVRMALPAIVSKLPYCREYRGFVVDDQITKLIYTLSVKGNQIRIQTVFSAWKKLVFIGKTDIPIRIITNPQNGTPKAEIITDLEKSRFRRKTT